MKKLLKAVVLAAVAASSVGLAVPAQAAPARVGVCHDPRFGGNFYCDSSDSTHGEFTWYLPNNTQQVFVVGTNWSVWTRWSYRDGSLSSWTNLGGQVDHHNPWVHWRSIAGWSVTIDVTGTDGGLWYDTRYADGTWSGWKDLPPS
ncbi:hypothetical protein ACWGCW_36755 [Streptomyces sp. NPDC054933]